MAVLVATAVHSQNSTTTQLFAGDTPLQMRLEAPFQTLFARTGKSSAQQITGTLSYVDEASGRQVVIPGVTFTIRGNTSADTTECSFPKLKAAFPVSASLDGTLFRGMKSLKIGTHCGERPEGERTPKGRMANDRAPVREALVYRLLDALGIPSLQARPADITYVDGEKTTKRHAMLLEDMSKAIKRLGAVSDIDKTGFTSGLEMFPPVDAAKMALGEALIGNFDWCVLWTADDTYRCDKKETLWNVAALGRPDGKAIPVMYDFDVAGMVAGGHGWFPRVFDESFSPRHQRQELEVLGQVQRPRSLFSRATLNAARRQLADRKAAAYRALDSSRVDPNGRANIKAYMDAFFGAIETDAAYYRPVVVSQNVAAFADAARTRPVCGVTLPPGTVVADADEASTTGATTHTAGRMAHVRVLDVLWKWAMNRRCDALRSEPVWIDRGAIGTNYPDR